MESGGQKRGACACVDEGASTRADALGRRSKDGMQPRRGRLRGQRGQRRQQQQQEQQQHNDEGQRLSDRVRRRPDAA